MRPITKIVAIMACLIAMGSETARAASPPRHDATPLAAPASRIPYSTGDSYTFAGACRAVLVGDFNRDHMNDLVTSTGTGVQLWINDGAGRLAPHDLGIPPGELRSADMDGDGLADLVTPTNVYRGRGNGTVENGVSYRSGGACGLAIGDLDNDGHPDIALADCDAGNIRIFLARDSGFYAVLLRSTVPNPTQLLISDFDGDAIRDLAVVGSEGDSGLIAVRIGLGWAMFRDPITRTTGQLSGVEVGDLDSDGFPDLAAASWGNRLTIAWNDGHARFDATTVLTSRNETTYGAPALADLDGDGRLDIASAGYSREAGRMQLFTNLGGRRFDSSLSYFVSSWSGCGGLETGTLADLDGRAGPELVAFINNHCPHGTSEMRVIRHLGGRALAGLEDYAVGNEWLQLEAVDQGTGRQDLLAHGTEHTWLLRSRVDGTFETPVEISTLEAAAIPMGAGPLRPRVAFDSLVISADFDRDGRDDRAVVRKTCSDYGCPPADSLTIFRAHEDGSLSIIESHGLAIRTDCCSPYPIRIFAANFDGDAYLDLAVLEYLGGNGPSQMSILLNRGDGRFTDAVAYRIRSEDALVEVRDLTGDGRDDFVAAPSVGDWLLVNVNRGDGTFESDTYPFDPTSSMYFDVQDHPQPVFGDWNGDGRPDIAYAYRDYNNDPEAGVGVLLNLTPQHSTPVVLSLVRAELEGNRVHVIWQSGSTTLATLTVERRIGNGPWMEVGATRMNGEGFFDYVDTDIRPGQRHRYRLAEAGGASYSSEASVDVPGPGAGLELAVQSIRPNPVRREATLSFSLASDDPARVEVIEVGGRRVMTVPIASSTAGRHVLALPAGGTLSPGLYWIRLSQGARAATARMVVIR